MFLGRSALPIPERVVSMVCCPRFMIRPDLSLVTLIHTFQPNSSNPCSPNRSWDF